MAIALRGSTVTGNSNVSGSVAVTKPTGVVSGDVWIIAIGGDSTAAGMSGFTTPSGWTLVASDHAAIASTTWTYVFIRECDGSEGSTQTIAHGGNGTDNVDTVWASVAYSGVNTSTQQDAAATSGTTLHVSPSITTVTANAEIVVTQFHTGITATTVASSGLTLEAQKLGSNVSVSVFDVVKAAAGATGTYTTTGGSDKFSVTMALRPAPTIINGVTSYTIDPITLSSASTIKLQASSSAVIGAITTSVSAATLKLQAAETNTLDPFILSATGAAKLQATLSTAIGTITGVETGVVKLQSTESMTLDNMTLASVGVLKLQAVVAATIDPFTSVATGAVKLQATAASIIDPFTAVFTGGPPPISGVLNATIDPITTIESGTLATHGVVAATIDPILGTETGTLTTHGVVGGTIAPFTLAATGAVKVQAVESQTIGTITLVAVGKIIYAGVLNKTFGNFSLATAGHQRIHPRGAVVMSGM